MRVVVTGGAGQLGTAVLRKLARDPSVTELVSLDVRPPVVADPKVSHVLADVRDPGIEGCFRGAAAVVHLAFIVTRVLAPEVFEAINVGGSKNVFERAHAAGVRHILYASSVAAYGVVDQTGVVTEGSPRVRDPRFPYAACKHDVETFLDEWEPRHPGVVVTRMRPSVLMGTRIEHNLGAALHHRVLPALPRPVPMVWDEDVAQAFALALQKKAGGAFNLTCDEPLDGRALAQAGGLVLLPLPESALAGAIALSDFLAKQGIGVDPAWVRAVLADLAPYDTSRAKEVLGWKPECPTGESVIRRFVESDPGRMDPRLVVFFRGAERLLGGAPAGVGEADVHLWLTGRGGGDVRVTVQEGRLRARLGVPRPPASVAIVPTSSFLDMLAGRLDPAAAEGTDHLQVEGDASAGPVLAALVARFRERAGSAKGLQGKALRAFAAWL